MISLVVISGMFVNITGVWCVAGLCTEIMDGNVMFLNNNLLCFENTINWKDILTGENSEVMHHRSSKDINRECTCCAFVDLCYMEALVQWMYTCPGGRLALFIVILINL